MQHAFVIRFSAACSSVDTFIGKIEHVRSGRAIHFNGLPDFLTFVLDNLDAERRSEQQQAPDNRLSPPLPDNAGGGAK